MSEITPEIWAPYAKEIMEKCPSWSQSDLCQAIGLKRGSLSLSEGAAHYRNISRKTFDQLRWVHKEVMEGSMQHPPIPNTKSGRRHGGRSPRKTTTTTPNPLPPSKDTATFLVVANAEDRQKILNVLGMMKAEVEEL